MTQGRLDVLRRLHAESAEVDQPTEHVRQGVSSRAVRQGGVSQSSRYKGCDTAQESRDRTLHVRTVDVPDAQISPRARQTRDGAIEPISVARQARCIDRPGRRAADYSNGLCARGSMSAMARKTPT